MATTVAPINGSRFSAAPLEGLTTNGFLQNAKFGTKIVLQLLLGAIKLYLKYQDHVDTDLDVMNLSLSPAGDPTATKAALHTLAANRPLLKKMNLPGGA